MTTKRVWCIFYRIRINSNTKWSGWCGPCGIYALDYSCSKRMTNSLRGRPFFFRTRKQARDMAKELDLKKNITWTWVQHTVRPVNLTYKVLQ